jgi:hypothetical protein
MVAKPLGLDRGPLGPAHLWNGVRFALEAESIIHLYGSVKDVADAVLTENRVMLT